MRRNYLLSLLMTLNDVGITLYDNLLDGIPKYNVI